MKTSMRRLGEVLRAGLICLCVMLCAHSASGQDWSLRELKGKYLQGELTPMEKRGRWGFADDKQRMVIKNIFEAVIPFEDSLAMVRYDAFAWRLQCTLLLTFAAA